MPQDSRVIGTGVERSYMMVRQCPVAMKTGICGTRSFGTKPDILCRFVSECFGYSATVTGGSNRRFFLGGESLTGLLVDTFWHEGRGP